VQEFDDGHTSDDDRIIVGMEDSVESEVPERRTDERRSRREYVFRDKRTGFDRRREPADGWRGLALRVLIRLRDNPGTLQGLLIIVNALNLADLALTINALGNGASEANPVMASLFKAGPVWAGIFKTLAVLVATLMVWEYRRYRKALLAGIIVFLLFTAVFVYHMVGLSLLN
jgi:hypothetical protein